MDKMRGMKRGGWVAGVDGTRDETGIPVESGRGPFASQDSHSHDVLASEPLGPQLEERRDVLRRKRDNECVIGGGGGGGGGWVAGASVDGTSDVPGAPFVPGEPFASPGSPGSPLGPLLEERHDILRPKRDGGGAGGGGDGEVAGVGGASEGEGAVAVGELGQPPIPSEQEAAPAEEQEAAPNEEEEAAPAEEEQTAAPIQLEEAYPNEQEDEEPEAAPTEEREAAPTKQEAGPTEQEVAPAEEEQAAPPAEQEEASPAAVDDDDDAASELLGPLLEEWPDLASLVLAQLDDTDCALLARVGHPWLAAVLARDLPRAGWGLPDIESARHVMPWSSSEGSTTRAG